MTKNKKILVSCLLLVLTVIYTLVVKNYDTAPIGPNESVVGLSNINGIVHNQVGVNMLWYEITKYLGILPFIAVAYYGFKGLSQLIKEKSLAKVDKNIIFLGIFYVLIAIVYVFFEKVIINYRPTLIDGILEASYPSSHTLLAICICGSTVIMNKHYINNIKIRNKLNILLFLLMVIIVIGRILSGVHWASDIVGGLLISLFLISLLKIFVE